MTDQNPASLDPADWEAFRRVAHAAVDDAIARFRGLPDAPVWRVPTDAARAAFTGPAPRNGRALAEVYEAVKRDVLPWSMGNQNPRFWGWYMGAGHPGGVLGDFLAGVDGTNCGGGDTSAAWMERQVLRWLAGICGLPEDAGGVLTSSGSMANFTGLAVARTKQAGVDVRTEGVGAIPQPLRFYASKEAHSCVAKALEALGHGKAALGLVPSGADLAMDLGALARMVAQDRAAGWKPACVVGTAGATNSGAIDDLRGIAELCRREGLWFHVDGCVGAVLKLSPSHAGLVDGLEEADSVALDLHKWLQVPFGVGAVLVRDRQAHRDTFAAHPDYLTEKTRGLANGEFLADYTMDLSRGFSALKVWMSFMEHGTEKLGAMIDQTIALARHACARISSEPDLEALAPAPINVVCFRFRGDRPDDAALGALNHEIMLSLQEDGTAVLSDTQIGGRLALRIAISNHRTRAKDIDHVLGEVVRRGRAGSPAAGGLGR